jgi:hypothetical protein
MRPSACGLGDERHAGGEELRIAAKFVHQEALDQRRIGGIDHGFGADERGDHPAAVDVADQHDRHICCTREAHIGNVVGAEIDLRRAAGTLGEHNISVSLQPREAVQHERHQLGLGLLELGGRSAPIDLAPHYDLRADIALWLEQHRVHMDRG